MADTTRMKALKNLSNSLPVANAQVAAGQNAARQMQIQSAVKAAPQKAGTATAQETGASVAANAGQQMIQNAGQTIQQQQQVGQVGLAEQARQNQAEVQSLASGGREQTMDNVQRLAALDSKAKKELYDDQMSFARDENGRTIFNEQQIADYARMNAKSNEEFKNYAQVATQASNRKLQLMETAYKKVQEDLNFKYAEAKQKGDQAAQKQIASDQSDMAARMQRERAKAANNGAMWQTGGAIVGTVVGGIYGGPAGAMAGGAAGGAAGSMIGGMLG